MSALPRIAVATNNRGKLREFVALMGDAATIVPFHDLALALPEETSTSFKENALVKARHVASVTGMLTIADDSGIEVDVLNGAPGVRSARFAGPTASDDENRRLLLERLEGVVGSRRAARFVCVIAIADGFGSVHTEWGSCDGFIALHESGNGGFGYDPIFALEDGRTMAELSSGDKNVISHRGIALRKSMPVVMSALRSGKLPIDTGIGPGPE